MLKPPMASSFEQFHLPQPDQLAVSRTLFPINHLTQYLPNTHIIATYCWLAMNIVIFSMAIALMSTSSQISILTQKGIIDHFQS
jgi:hypothetical protein